MSNKSKTRIGICRACSKKTELTFEHIPPKSAFNNNRFYYTTNVHPLFEKKDAKTFEELTSFDKSKAKKNQGGIGVYSLCGMCNNFFGTWYVRAYKDWINQSFTFFNKENEVDRDNFNVKIQPLNVFKQILSMFFSINKTLAKQFPELKLFLLKKENNVLPDGIRLFIYYNFEGVVRYEPDCFVGNFSQNNEIIHASEITFPPIGYVLVLNGQNVDNRLTEITYFAKFELNEIVSIPQKLNFLPTHLKVILDYRTVNEIEQGLNMNYESIL